MDGRWRHPLTLLLAIIATLTVPLLFGFGSYGLMNSIVLDGQEEIVRVDWASTIGGAVWITVFAAGIIGFMINGLGALRCCTRRVSDFSRLADLPRRDVVVLEEWLTKRSFGPQHLAGLWEGEH